MKFSLFCTFSVVLCLTYFKGFATDRTFTGTGGNWHTASNWSPSGVPGTSDRAFIPANKAVTVSSSANVGSINIDGTNAQLTVNSGVTLTLTGSPVTSGGYDCKVVINNSAKLTNNGAIDFSLSADIEALIMIATSGTMTNNVSGSITYKGPASRVSLVAIGNRNGTITNNGLIDMNSAWSLVTLYTGGEATNTSTGTITGSSLYIIDMDQATFHNYGLVQKSGTGNGSSSVPSGSAFNNYACARLITNRLENSGVISNSGCVIASGIISGLGSIINNGVFISAGTRTITNNKLRVNNSTPIFSYGASNDFTIDGIYKDASALVSAGTFTAPNSFTPSESLPAGSQTLYAKITPASEGCEFIVSFTYQMTALPVTLISFSGKKMTENQNTLTWVTADEKAFSHFEILRSSDARSFEAIGRVNGNENKNSGLKSYKFIDDLARGYNYYRLKMVDRAANGQDGTHELSKIISIENSVENTVVGSLYPNPTNEMVYVDIFTEEAGNWNITQFNQTGTIIRNETRILQKGMNKVKLDQFNQVINLIRFENGKVSEIRKVLRE